MFSTMEQCTNFIFKLRASQYKGAPLEAAQKLLAYLGNPHTKREFIHFAGSNGKGSTLNATREILMQHGKNVGAFISPHLERPNERVTINKIQISDKDFLACANEIKEAVDAVLDGQFPSFFEVMTVLAFVYFAKQDVDVVLLETGIGGRIDTTNVVTPKVSVITTVSLEHTAMLGDTYALVAAEKAGIIKRLVPVVIGVKQQEARAVIKEEAEKLNAPMYVLGESIQVESTATNHFTYKGIGTIECLALAMKGAHQRDNAALAITAATLYLGEVNVSDVREALKTAVWEGRFEHLTNQIIVDGAHNSEGTEALLQTIRENYPAQDVHFIYAAMNDKDHGISIGMMDEMAKSIHFTQLPLPNAMPAHQLAELSTHSVKSDQANWQLLVEQKVAELKENDLLVITGSLYFIGEVRNWFVKEGLK